MKIIVTGGAGFIGSNVVDLYISKGHKVAVIDDLSTGFRKNLNPKAKFYKADIKNLEEIDRIFALEKPEAVNHHAAVASVIESIKNPIKTFETNVIGTANLLISFGKHGRGKNKKFIFSSTGGAMYGSPKVIPVDEKTAPHPISPYSLSKLLGEETIKYYARELGFDYLIFRYANVYGPRQNPKGEGGVIAIFSGLMKSGKRPTIFGNGNKVRDYVYVGDIAEANMLGLKKGRNEIMNIGSGKPTSDKKIFDTVAEKLQFKMKPIYAPKRKGEVIKSALHAHHAKRVLSWHPKTKLEEGIGKTVHSV